MGFYEDVIAPLIGRSGALGEIGGLETLQQAVEPYQRTMRGVEDYYARPTAEMGPRGNLWQPGQPSAVPQPAPTQPPLPSETTAATPGIPYYLQNPSFGQAPTERPSLPTDIANVQGTVSDIEPPTMSLPAEGEPQKNEYETMVKSYLTRLQQPQDFPKPKEMNWVEKAAILLNPEQGEQLREQFQGQDYKNRLLAYQSNQQRQAQGAGIAEQMMQRQQETQRRDAERAWFRESAMANSGSAFVPKGYVWKNPELEATWKQKQRERQLSEERTNKYLEGPYGKPISKEAALKDLFSEQARLQGQLLTPGAQQMMVMAQTPGIVDPAMAQMLQDMQEQIKTITDKASVIQAMDPQDYADFAKLPGVKQDQIIQDYLRALGDRQMPGSTSVTPMPSQPTP